MANIIAPNGWEYSGPILTKKPFTIVRKNNRLLLKFSGHVVSNIQAIDRRSLDIVLASELDARAHWETLGKPAPIKPEKIHTLAQTLRDHVLEKKPT